MKLKIGWFLLILSLFVFQKTSAQDWPQWRGPNRDGILHDFSPPKVWPDTLLRKWQVPIGAGYSSPIVVNEKAFVQNVPRLKNSGTSLVGDKTQTENHHKQKPQLLSSDFVFV